MLFSNGLAWVGVNDMKGELLYEGKAKKVFRSKKKWNELILSYKDNATAYNGKKSATFIGKGRLNNRISALIFTILREKGIKSHFIKRLNETEQLVYRTKIIPLEIVVRNIAVGSITKRLGIKEKTAFSVPILELYYKNDSLDDPIINDDHAKLLTTLVTDELQQIKAEALEINTVLQTLFASINLTLIDFKLEFGWLDDGRIVLADEISPDTCRLWDTNTAEKLDKDVFREGIGDLLPVYERVFQRLQAVKSI